MGKFGGFEFDSELFAEHVAERPTWNNAILASGILAEDSTIMGLIGSKGNVAVLPFYKAISIDDYAPLNNDGIVNNVPQELTGGKQTAMLIQRMKAWKAKDFIKDLTGADPMQHVANSVADYYSQVWTMELMGIADTVMKVSALQSHVTDIASSTSSVADTNKVNETTLIYAKQKALGDMADGFGLLVMHSYILARYKALGMVDYVKYSAGLNGLKQDVELPTIAGMVVVTSDRNTVDTTGSVPKYKTTILGRGAFLTAQKTNYEAPYEVERDNETAGGVEKLFTKQGRVLHPNGLSFAASTTATDSPTHAELTTAGKWTLEYNHKNVRIGQIISNG